ncbi:SulP family inorganic anion transporter [Aquitalea denitrificans]|uniref:SulP family inorganic anion transporter n=1 Tax=Aquitalea denitrificans TaxID=519081 RepID=UPI001F0DC0B0|nr:sulfate permease [Aquitalea denitrificans]
MAALISLFPGWVGAYRRHWLAGDLTAGVVVTLLLIPQSLAYALLAGLPVQAGLYASVAPLLVYAFSGRGYAQSVGPMALTSLLTAATLSRFAESGSSDYLALALWLAILSGLMLLAMGMARLGFIADLLSEPVLAAFTTASALLIVLSQLGPLAGLHLPGNSLPQWLLAAWQQAAAWQASSLWVGASALALLLGLRRWGPAVLQSLGMSTAVASVLLRIAPVLAMLAGMLLPPGWQVPVVGPVPAGLPVAALPLIPLSRLADLAMPAFFIALINYVQSLSVAQLLAARRQESVDPDRELVALGLCNIAAGLAGGFPVTGGLSRSVVNADAGANSQLASLVTAAGMLLLMFLATGALARLPLPVLAATIIASLLSMLKVASLRRAWLAERADAVAWLLTFGLVLLLGVDSGIMAGVLVSLATLLWRSSRPHIAVLGRVPGTHHFRNCLRHTVECLPGVLLLRVDESLYFGNARQVRQALLSRVGQQGGVRQVVLVMSAVNRVDTTALTMLEGLDLALQQAGVELHLAEIKGPVTDILQRAGLAARFAGRVHLSTQAAWQSLAGPADYQI